MPFDPPVVTSPNAAYQIGTSGDDSYDFVAEAARLRDKWVGVDSFGREADKKKIRVLIETRHFLRKAQTHRGLFSVLARAKNIKYGKLENKVLRFIHGMSVETSRSGVARFGAILGWLAEQEEDDKKLWERVRPMKLGQLGNLAADRKVEDCWWGYWGIGEGLGYGVEWYTPPAFFPIFGVTFAADVATIPGGLEWIPAAQHFSREDDGLTKPWPPGPVFLNPPFGKDMKKWAARFIEHGNGIMVTPDTTSTAWCQRLVIVSDKALLINKKIRFWSPDGEAGRSFPRGTAFFAIGEECVEALDRAYRAGMGVVVSFNPPPDTSERLSENR